MRVPNPWAKGIDCLTIFARKRNPHLIGILKCLDFKIYTKTPDDLRMNRRITRDRKKKLRSKSNIIHDGHAHVMPTHKEFVELGAAVADLVASGESDVEETVEMVVAKRMEKNKNCVEPKREHICCFRLRQRF